MVGERVHEPLQSIVGVAVPISSRSPCVLVSFDPAGVAVVVDFVFTDVAATASPGYGGYGGSPGPI